MSHSQIADKVLARMVRAGCPPLLYVVPTAKLRRVRGWLWWRRTSYEWRPIAPPARLEVRPEGPAVVANYGIGWTRWKPRNVSTFRIEFYTSPAMSELWAATEPQAMPPNCVRIEIEPGHEVMRVSAS